MNCQNPSQCPRRGGCFCGSDLLRNRSDGKGTAAFGVYAASKAAIRSFVRTWTTDLKDRRIRSNVVSPGPINTPLAKIGNLQTSLRASCPRSRWAAWGNSKKLLRWRCFWRRTTLVSSRVSNCSLTAAEPRSNRRPERRYCHPSSLRVHSVVFVGDVGYDPLIEKAIHEEPRIGDLQVSMRGLLCS